jgi:hypothetical protein
MRRRGGMVIGTGHPGVVLFSGIIPGPLPPEKILLNPGYLPIKTIR